MEPNTHRGDEVIQGEVSGSRATGMKDIRGRTLREIFLIITEEDAKRLQMGQKVAMDSFHTATDLSGPQ